MGRLPTAEDLGGLPSGRSGRPIANVDTSAIGRGAARFGQAIAGVGDTVSAVYESRQRETGLLDALKKDGQATKLLNDFERSFDNDSDYLTFNERFEEGASEIGNRVASTIRDDDMRQKFLAGYTKDMLRARERVIDLGANRRREANNVELKLSLEGYQQVIADPDATGEEREEAKLNARAAIDVAQHSGDLTPAKAEEWRDAIIDGGAFVLAKREIDRNPDIITGNLPEAVSGRASIAMDFFQSNGYTKEQAAGIVGNLIAESKLDTGIAGDGGTSFGIAQWRDDRLERLRAHATKMGTSWQDFETQLDFVLHELEGRESKANAALKNATTIEEATAAFIGYERPKGWTEANPQAGHNFNGRLTYAGQAAGENIRPDWYISQSPENQLRLEAYADARRNEMRVASDRELAALQTSVKDSLDLRIANDDPTLFRQDILNDPVLDDGQKATLLRSYDSANADRAAIAAIQAGARINVFDSDQRRIGDKAYDQMIQGASPEEAGDISRRFVETTGYMPDPLRANLRNASASGNRDELISAMNAANYYQSIAPRHFDSFEGGDKVRKDLEHFNAALDLGYSQQEAAKQIIDARDPERRRERATLLETKAVKDALDEVDENSVTDMFDAWGLGNRPELSETETGKAAAVADYRDIYEESIVEANGDIELGKQLADNRFKKVYNVSDLTMSGNDVVQKYPPEVAYPAVDGSHAYIRDQAYVALGESFALDAIATGEMPPSAEDIFLQPYRDTEADIKAGRPARYLLFYNKDGRIQQYNLPFYAIPEAADDTPDLTSYMSSRDRNRRQELERQKLLETGKTGGTVFDEMNATAEEVMKMEGR